MVRALWNEQVLADSDDTVLVEGNHYFPPGSVRSDLLQPSDTQTVCGWKGTARYYHVAVADATNRDAAWYYPDPKPEARAIKDRIAFWKGVKVE